LAPTVPKSAWRIAFRDAVRHLAVCEDFCGQGDVAYYRMGMTVLDKDFSSRSNTQLVQ
jgi:hypothetical protein